jgi:benzoylformate decarboxylase
MGFPDRAVVAVVGDGASLYTIQSLWSASHYGVGALLIVMANRGYAVMDGLARNHGGAGAWPSFEAVSIVSLARGLGCPARRIECHDELLQAFDEVLPTLAQRSEPLLLEVAVASA